MHSDYTHGLARHFHFEYKQEARMIPNLLLYSFYNYHISLIEMCILIKSYEVASSSPKNISSLEVNLLNFLK